MALEHAAFDEQPGGLNGQRLQEEDAAKRWPFCCYCARHLQVACPWEGGAALDDVACNQRVFWM
jgi:hypothetical protein